MVQCSKKLFICIMRASPLKFQKRCARSVAMTVKTPKAPAPSHTRRFKIMSADPMSWVSSDAKLKAHDGCSPTCSISASPPSQSKSLEKPPTRKGRVTATRATKSAIELSSSRAMRDGVSRAHCVLGTAFISNRPARAAERAPKGLQIVRGRVGAPSRRMVVAMYRASMSAPPRKLCHLSIRYIGIWSSPGSVAAECPHRRPVWHGRRQGRVIVASKFFRAVDDFPAHDRKKRHGVCNIACGTREEVAVGDHDIGELTYDDATLLAFFVGKPGAVLSPHAKCGFAIQTI